MDKKRLLSSLMNMCARGPTGIPTYNFCLLCFSEVLDPLQKGHLEMCTASCSSHNKALGQLPHTYLQEVQLTRVQGSVSM